MYYVNTIIRFVLRGITITEIEMYYVNMISEGQLCLLISILNSEFMVLTMGRLYDFLFYLE